MSFAVAVASTRKAMLPAQFFKNFLRGLCASGLVVGIATANAFDCFLIVVTFPFERGGQNIVKSRSRVLLVPPSIFCQLRH